MGSCRAPDLSDPGQQEGGPCEDEALHVHVGSTEEKVKGMQKGFPELGACAAECLRSWFAVGNQKGAPTTSLNLHLPHYF